MLGLDAFWPEGHGDADGEAVFLTVREGFGLPAEAGGPGGVVHGDDGVTGAVQSIWPMPAEEISAGTDGKKEDAEE